MLFFCKQALVLLLSVTMVKCLVVGCPTRVKSLGGRENVPSHLMLHRFPTDSGRYNTWLEAVKAVNGNQWEPSGSSRLCSIHFGESSWERTRVDGKKKLKSDAFPNLFPSYGEPIISDHTYISPSTVPVVRGKRVLGDSTNCTLSAASKEVKVPWKPMGKDHINDHTYGHHIGSASEDISHFEDSVVESSDDQGSAAIHLGLSAEMVSPETSASGLDLLLQVLEPEFEATNSDGILRSIDTQSPETPSEIRDTNDPSHICNLRSIPAESTDSDHLAILASKLDNHDQTISATTSNLQTIPTRPTESNIPSISDDSIDGNLHSLSAGCLDSLSECADLLDERIMLDDSKEKEIDFRENALAEENKKLKAELDRITKLANKVCSQNEVLRRSNKKLFKERDTLIRAKEERERHIGKILRTDQLRALERKNTRGMKWDTETIKEAIVLRAKCGTTGYEAIRERFPYPHHRTLRARVEHIEFNPGILDEVFEMLKLEAEGKRNEWRDCGLAMDEMAIEPCEMVDPVTKSVIGEATLKSHSGIATKALVFYLGGVVFRWKVAVAWELTRSKAQKGSDKDDSTGKALAEIIFAIVDKAEDVGYRLHFVTSDMGPDNRNLWKILGIYANRSGDRCFIVHPRDKKRMLCILPDVPHVHKSLRSMLASNKVITLPDDIVAQEKLPSNEVNVKHLEELVEREDDLELKVAFRLRKEALENKDHFANMKVQKSTSVFCQRTASGLSLMALEKGDPSYITTAWFVSLLTRWKTLMTSRSRTVALSLVNKEAYNAAIALLVLVISTFRGMRIGTSGHWKPVQTGVILATQAVLLLQSYFLKERGFKYLLTSRFTQDFLENLFSCIRFRHATPHALLFKYLLKNLTLAQYCTAKTNSSYEQDVDGQELDFLNITVEKAKQRKQLQQSDGKVTISLPQLQDEDLKYFSDWERLVLYDMTGAVLHSVKANNVVCACCFDALLWKDESQPHPYATLTKMNSYTEGALYEASEDCFKAVWKAELSFRMAREEFKKLEGVNVYDFLVKSLLYVWTDANIPSCHEITTKILKRYFSMRCKQYGQRRRQELKARDTVPMNSKTMAMHALVK